MTRYIYRYIFTINYLYQLLRKYCIQGSWVLYFCLVLRQILTCLTQRSSCLCLLTDRIKASLALDLFPASCDGLRAPGREPNTAIQRLRNLCKIPWPLCSSILQSNSFAAAAANLTASQGPVPRLGQMLQPLCFSCWTWKTMILSSCFQAESLIR